jgi:DNA polymerase III epsilon subunit-like protein
MSDSCQTQKQGELHHRAIRMSGDDELSNAVSNCVSAAIHNVRCQYTRAIAIDTETTSLTGVVIQVAAVEFSSNEICIAFNGILRPPDGGFVFDPRAVAVHGITNDRVEQEGVDAVPFLRHFVGYLKEAHASGVPIVAHNSRFDVARLNFTMEQHGMDERIDFPVFCTMRASKQFCDARDCRGRLKYPKNEFLYKRLHGVDASALGGSLHDAATDAQITLLSYVEGRRQALWSRAA